MKIIIIGAGEVGFHIARKLSEEGQDVTLIDKAPLQIKRINENLDVRSVLGSGTSPRVLKEAGAVDTDLLVAATDSDEVNLFACLLGRNLNPYMVKIARVRNQEYIDEEHLIGQELLGIDHVINPESVMVESILSLMEYPWASEVIDFAGGRVKLIGITVKEGSPLTGKPLMSLTGQAKKLLIGAIVRGEQVLIPRGKDQVMPNDLVYLVTQGDEALNLLPAFDIHPRPLKRVIIVGGGQTGGSLAAHLDGSRIKTTIIEKDEAICTRLSENLERILVIKGDGTDKNLLIEENVQDVDFLIALTGDEENNILISLLAKGLGARRTITRISKFSYIPLISAIGLDTVVSPRLSAVRAILQFIRRGKIISVAPLKGEHAEAIEAEALETSEVVNQPLAQVKFPKGAIVGAVVRGESIIIPSGDTVIQPKDHLIIFAQRQVIPKLEKLLTVRLEYF